MAELDLTKLQTFLEKASASTYAGGGKYEETPERSGFRELTYAEGDLSYRDSYSGFIQSWGSEVIRQNDKPVWSNMYGGWMSKGSEELAGVTFEFLKKCLLISKLSKSIPSFSMRGPSEHTEGDWKYTYAQTGDFAQYNGHEEIYFQGKLVFVHDTMGGLFIDKE